VAIHAGSKGAYLAQKDAALQHVPSQAQVINDVTGAGDAATAGLVYGLLQGGSLANAISVGQEMAARVIASNQSTLE
jgi:pseudouridine kinase